MYGGRSLKSLNQRQKFLIVKITLGNPCVVFYLCFINYFLKFFLKDAEKAFLDYEVIMFYFCVNGQEFLKLHMLFIYLATKDFQCFYRVYKFRLAQFHKKRFHHHDHHFFLQTRPLDLNYLLSRGSLVANSRNSHKLLQQSKICYKDTGIAYEYHG